MKAQLRMSRRMQTGAVSRQALIAAAAAVIVVLAAVWLFLPRPDDALPEPGVVPETTDIERGDSAREVIAELQASSPPDYDLAYERGQAFQSEGRLADAQLMYFFAARGGQSEAAFRLGSMYDPRRFSTETSVMQEPDPFQAYKWYAQARDGGVADAAARLQQLREWAEQEAPGNLEAEQLLLQWE